MGSPLKVVHYLNQFFGGVGSEEKANLPTQVREGAVGPGRALQQLFENSASVVATILCGDNYFNEEKSQAQQAVTKVLNDLKPDVVVAGPAFNSGRYGLACVSVCKVARNLGIPALTGMHPDNPGVLQIDQQIIVVATGPSTADMQEALNIITHLSLKLGKGEDLGPARLEGYLPTGVRKIVLREEPGYKRAVDMLAAKLKGEPFQTEIPMNPPERVPPAPPTRDLRNTVIALVTTGGLVRKGNPEGQSPSNAIRYHSHPVENLESLTSEQWEAFHSGYFNHIVNKNPNYILPLSYVRELQKEKIIKGVHPLIYAMPGVMTPVARSISLGCSIAVELLEAKVGGCILVAT